MQKVSEEACFMILFKAPSQKDADVRTLFGYTLLERSPLTRHEEARNLLEQWFQDYVSHTNNENAKKLCADFQSKKDRQHQAAFFELYCYTLWW
jgi:hypothetical protein